MSPSSLRPFKVRPTRFLLLSALFVFILWFIFRSGHGSSVSQPPPTPPAPPTYEIWGIRELEPEIKVSTIRVQTKFRTGFQAPIKQDVDFGLEFTNVDATQPLPELPITDTIITVAEDEKTDASEIIFGMGTKLDRLRDVLPAASHWASGTNTHIIALVQPENANDEGPSREEVTKLYKEHDIKLTIIESKLDWVSQIMALPGIIYDHAVPGQTKWGCVMDDDTYFFSMKKLQAMLGKYDATLPYYVGGISENKESWDRLGYFAFGGAGIFLSLPLLEEMRPRIDECIAIPDPAGDERLNTCIMNFTTTKFTWDHKLFQVDLHGDVTGFYEAPRERPVSTHHWKSWHHHDMAHVGQVSRICGSQCVLQKYMTKDTWMITNGFSVVQYSYSADELKQQIPGAMEHTWDHTAWVIQNSWKYTLYPLKPKDPGKKQYVIEKSVETDSDITQYYVSRRDNRGQGIVRIIWTK